MTSFSDTDVLFVNKLEEVTCRTNEDVLSEGDAVYARTLLSVSRNALLDSKQSLEPSPITPSTESTYSQYVSILSIALAPHRRIPSEIWIRVFQFLPLPSRSRGRIHVPPVLSDIPWVLGRVCSLWRQLSYSAVPHIWSGFIGFELSIEERRRVEEGLFQLKCFVEIYPEICRLCLLIRDIEMDAWLVYGPALIPYLSRANILCWNYRPLHISEKELLKSLPPYTFSRLEHLDIQLPSDLEDAGDNDGIVLYPDLFGHSSRLCELTLCSDSLNFLFSGIPWPLLRTVTFSFYMTHPNMRAVWTRIREENPFRTMASLETLTFELSGSRLDVILSMDFPWYQIKFLTITWQVDDPPNPTMIVRALSKCRTLSKLDLCSRKTTFHDHQNARFNDNFTHKELLDLNSLINLDVSGGLPSSVIKSIATSEQLLTVTTWDAGIKVQVFYHILQHCPNLRSLVCTISDSDSESVLFLHAPTAAHLKHLTMVVHHVSSFPLPECPSLTSFTIHNCTTKNTGLFVSIINFLERSSFARLQRLSFTSHEVDHSPNQQLLGDLLFALHPCIHLAIKGLRISEEHLERISSGLLLPGIQSLRLDIFDPYQAHLSMVERRLEFERGMGSINLRSIRGRVRDPSLLVDSSEASKNFITKVQQIKERYGVYFEYNFPGPWDD